MAKVLPMPALGQTVEEQRILQWFKQEGDAVTKGEPLAEFETDKVNIEWESPETGVLRRILAPVDAFVPINAPIAIIGSADESIENLLPGGALTPCPSPLASGSAGGRGGPGAVLTSASPETSPSGAPAREPAVDGVAGTPLPPAEPGARGEGPGVRAGAVLASPRARRYAGEFGIDLGALFGRGTGPGGRVQEKDVIAFRQEQQAAAGAAALEAAGRGPKASPLARAVASDSGLDLQSVSGSGAGGRITAGDVRQAAEPTPAPSAAPTTGGTRTVTLTGLRKRVADNIARSVRSAPHVTLNLQADMTEAQRLRASLLPNIEKATGVRLSPTDIIVKAAAVALKELPYVNAHIEGDTLTFFDDVHIGLAVSLGEEGLIVPVIKDAGRLGLSDIARARQDLATRARKGQLGAGDISGGTFTITNLGAYGIESFNPIIAPPQVAILGVGTIQDQVVARDGAPAVRPMMGLSLSFDHRAMDGAPAAAFLARVREILENPYLMLT